MVIFTLPRNTQRLLSKPLLAERLAGGLTLIRRHGIGTLGDAHLAEVHIVGLQIELGGLRVQIDRAGGASAMRQRVRAREREAGEREQGAVRLRAGSGH